MVDSREFGKIGQFSTADLSWVRDLEWKGHQRELYRPLALYARCKVRSIAGRQSGKFIRARLFLRYVLELRIENIDSAVRRSVKMGACIVTIKSSNLHKLCALILSCASLI